jgi:hypothetical protein
MIKSPYLHDVCSLRNAVIQLGENNFVFDVDSLHKIHLTVLVNRVGVHK